MTQQAVARTGVTLAEVLVATLLGLFVANFGLSTVRRLIDAVDEASRRGDLLSSRRVTVGVLRRELAAIGRVGDYVVDQDSISLRAFRGMATVCLPPDSGREIVVAYEGDRAPAPRKDSVELVFSSGASVWMALESVRSETAMCTGRREGEVVQRWTLSDVANDSLVFLRLYERASYHLSGSAFRFRSGSGGRQPLTPALWLDAATGFSVPASDSSVSLVLSSAAPLLLAWRGSFTVPPPR